MERVEENNRTDSIKVFEYTKQVPEFMSISDLVVTKPGGLTTSESLASNLPMVIINPIPGQEEENAEFLEENGIAIWIKKTDDPYLIASYHAIAQALSVVHTRGHAMGFVLYDLTSKIRRFGIDMKTLEESVDHYLTLLDEVKVNRSERKWATFIVSHF